MSTRVCRTTITLAEMILRMEQADEVEYHRTIPYRLLESESDVTFLPSSLFLEVKH